MRQKAVARFSAHSSGLDEHTWYERDRRRDKDNISSFGRKVIQDGLVKAGVLANDGWAQIAGFSDEFHVDAKRPRVEIEIGEVTI